MYRAGIMQPYFFPYAGYFGLMDAADVWIVFDTAQYIRRGWVNRNRVLTKSKQHWKHTGAAVRKAPQETPIHEILLADPAEWTTQVVRDLDYYRDHHAPNYDDVTALVINVGRRLQLSPHPSQLNSLLWHALDETRQWLELPIEMRRFSEIESELKLAEIRGPGDWALRISEALGATHYVNPPGGRDLFDADAFHTLGMQLEILHPQLPPYHQTGQTEFIPGLSILDVMMWNTPAAARAHAQAYEIERIQ